ncbi:hypothetical protein JCM8208_001656 [Rhodotorula glutinis]
MRLWSGATSFCRVLDSFEHYHFILVISSVIVYMVVRAREIDCFSRWRQEVAGSDSDMRVIGSAFVAATLVRATVIADGTSLQSTTLFDSVDWQASGVLLEGCDVFTGISDCHTLALAPSGQLARRAAPEIVDRNNPLVARAAPRQRIEFLSRPNSRDGETWTYSWSYRLAPGISTSDHFFHLVQLFSRTTNGFLFALDALDLGDGAGPVVRIVDSDQGRCATARGDCPSMPLGRFVGRTTRHVLRVRWGDEGFFDYQIRDLRTNARLLTYSRSSADLPANGYLKTGLHRAIIEGATSATAYVGDFAFGRE